MIPTLAGRIQTRLFLLGTVGLAWTIVVVPFLPKGGVSLGDTYAATILTLFIVALFGIGWELLYHLIQQYRWEKDWPVLYALVEGIPEGILAFLVVDALIALGPSPVTFFCHFASTWILVWLCTIGPMRMVLLRWRFNGGRIL
jgi:hypothetical protein